MAINEAEIRYCVALVPFGRRRKVLRRTVMTAFATLPAGRVLPFDSAAAIATRNTRDSAGRDVKLIDPWLNCSEAQSRLISSAH